uniref:Uncharacterized protein n=1 Tax=Onchocerca volvulus TaxID=6282 RepID=A0A8R1XTT2_ONCVO
MMTIKLGFMVFINDCFRGNIKFSLFFLSHNAFSIFVMDPIQCYVHHVLFVAVSQRNNDEYRLAFFCVRHLRGKRKGREGERSLPNQNQIFLTALSRMHAVASRFKN